MDKKVTIVIPTKNRYDALALTLWSLLTQTYKAWDVIIIDNSDHDKRIDLREHHLLSQILDLIIKDGHAWFLYYNEGQGPQSGHQIGLEATNTEYIWRIDDDEIARPDVLGRLVNYMEKDKTIGAVGPLVLLPDSAKLDHIPWMAGKIGWADWCLQNHDCTFDELVPVEHLHSSFIYRKDAAMEIDGFFQGFSRVGHREETDFSYRIYKAGYKLFVDTGGRLMHLRMPSGGIRSNNPTHELWLADDRLFWNRVGNLNQDKIFVPMVCGIGDIIASTSMLRALKKKNPDKEIILGVERGLANLVDYTCWSSDIVKKMSNKSGTPYHLGNADRHLTDAWCDMYGVENDHKLEVRMTSDDLSKKIEADKTVYLFTESKFAYKHWARDRWDKVIKYLQDKGYKVVEFPPPQHHILDMFTILKNCKFFITVDSWAGHAGNAVGKKGIVLWGETNPKHFGYDSNINIDKAEHNPAVQWTVNHSLTNEKMLKIEVKDVIKAIEDLEKELKS